MWCAWVCKCDVMTSSNVFIHTQDLGSTAATNKGVQEFPGVVVPGG